ncbi:MAG: hypothetical protein IT382_22300 [Deltaproteobacteria bacterium]|nr:hypothetical protein [Deltaproteobacteria bacterium]
MTDAARHRCRTRRGRQPRHRLRALERWLLGAMRHAHAKEIVEAGLEVRIGEQEPAILTADQPATRAAVAALLRMALDARDEFLASEP